MPKVLILTEVQEAMRARYKAMLLERFPQLTIDVVGHHNDVDPYIADVDILLCFSPPMADHVVRDAPKLKWIQALGTGVDNIVDLPSLGKEVLVTNVRSTNAVRSDAYVRLNNARVAVTSSQSTAEVSYSSSGGVAGSLVGRIAIVIAVTLVFGLIAIYLLEWLSQVRLGDGRRQS